MKYNGNSLSTWYGTYTGSNATKKQAAEFGEGITTSTRCCDSHTKLYAVFLSYVNEILRHRGDKSTNHKREEGKIADVARKTCLIKQLIEKSHK